MAASKLLQENFGLGKSLVDKAKFAVDEQCCEHQFKGEVEAEVEVFASIHLIGCVSSFGEAECEEAESGFLAEEL